MSIWLRRATLLVGLPFIPSACTGAPTPSSPPAPSAVAGASTPGPLGDQSARPASSSPATASPEAVSDPVARLSPSDSPRGRRDPFEAIAIPRRTEEGPHRSILTSAKLTGIVRGANGDLALVETPDGAGYILRPGDGLQDRRLLEIRRDSVVFGSAAERGSMSERLVLRLEATP